MLLFVILGENPNMDKAKRATVMYGSIELEVFQLPNGDYTFSQKQVSQSIEKHHKSLGEWLKGKSSEALPFKDFELGEISVESEAGNPIRINSIPMDIVLAYWSYWAQRGNTRAQALLAAGAKETLTRLCDNAFGIAKTEPEYQKALAEEIPQQEMFAEILQRLRSIEELTRENTILKERSQALEEARLRLDQASTEVPGARAVLDEAGEPSEQEDQYVSVDQYLASIGILESDRKVAIRRRAASFYRSAKHKNPKVLHGRNVYHVHEIEFIKQAIKAEFNF